MIKVYNMASGKIQPDTSDENYSDEVLYSELQPAVHELAELQLETVEHQPTEAKSDTLPDELADVDCESFISTQEHE